MTKALLAATGLCALLAACDFQPAEEPQPANQAAANEAQPPEPAATSIAALPPPANREAALKLMHDRHENMESIGDSVKRIGRALKSDNPDLELIRTSAARIAELAPDVPSWFPPGTGPDVGETHAKPEIWQKPDDFTAKARAMNDAAQAFNAAAEAGDMAAIEERFAALGKSCKACHDPYREEDD